MAKLKKKALKPKRQKTVTYDLGQKFFIEGVECAVGHINAGTAWLFPTFDDPESVMIARHISFARIDDQGTITLYSHAKQISNL